MPDQPDPIKCLEGLSEELDRLREQIDAAREVAMERRRVPDRRVRPRPTADRRKVA